MGCTWFFVFGASVFVLDYYLLLAMLLRSLIPKKVIEKSKTKSRTWMKCEWDTRIAIDFYILGNKTIWFFIWNLFFFLLLNIDLSVINVSDWLHEHPRLRGKKMDFMCINFMLARCLAIYYAISLFPFASKYNLLNFGQLKQRAYNIFQCTKITIKNLFAKLLLPKSIESVFRPEKKTYKR